MLPLNRTAVTSCHDTNGTVTPMSMAKRPSHQGRKRAESQTNKTIHVAEMAATITVRTRIASNDVITCVRRECDAFRMMYDVIIITI